MLEALLVFIGGVTGWLTNLWFERRALRQSELEKQRLRQELQSMQADLVRMRTTLLSLGGDEHSGRVAGPESRQLPERMLTRARRTQGPDGRVRIQLLVSHFVSEGFGRPDAERAMQQIIHDGAAERNGSWLRLS